MRLSNGIPVPLMGTMVPQCCLHHALLQRRRSQSISLLNWYEHERKSQFSDLTVLLSREPLKESEGFPLKPRTNISY